MYQFYPKINRFWYMLNSLTLPWISEAVRIRRILRSSVRLKEKVTKEKTMQRVT